MSLELTHALYSDMFQSLVSFGFGVLMLMSVIVIIVKTLVIKLRL